MKRRTFAKRFLCGVLTLSLLAGGSSLTGLAAPIGHTVGPIQPTDSPVSLMPASKASIVDDGTGLFPHWLEYDGSKIELAATNDSYARFKYPIGKWIDVDRTPSIHLKIHTTTPFNGLFFTYENNESKPDGMLHFTQDFASSFSDTLYDDDYVQKVIPAGSYDVYLNIRDVAKDFYCVKRDGGYVYLDSFLFVLKPNGIASIELVDVPAVPEKMDVERDLKPYDLRDETRVTYPVDFITKAYVTANPGSDPVLGKTFTLTNRGGGCPYMLYKCNTTISPELFPILYYQFDQLSSNGAGSADVGVNARITYYSEDNRNHGTVLLSELAGRGVEDFRENSSGYIDFRAFLKKKGITRYVRISQIQFYMYGQNGASVRWVALGMGKPPADIPHADSPVTGTLDLIPQYGRSIALPHMDTTNMALTPHADGSVTIMDTGGQSVVHIVNQYVDFTAARYINLSFDQLTEGAKCDVRIIFSAENSDKNRLYEVSLGSLIANTPGGFISPTTISYDFGMTLFEKFGVTDTRHVYIQAVEIQVFPADNNSATAHWTKLNFSA